jgi:hypothetical protein
MGQVLSREPGLLPEESGMLVCLRSEVRSPGLAVPGPDKLGVARHQLYPRSSQVLRNLELGSPMLWHSALPVHGSV